MNAYNFLMVSKPNPDAAKIREEIERNKLYKVRRAETARTSMDHILNSQIDCLVYNFQSYTRNKSSLITDLRDLGHEFPIMVFAGYLDSLALKDLEAMEKIVAIEKPFEAKDVWGICSKLVQGVAVKQRIHRRFYTNQNAVLEKTVTGETLKTQIYNMSRGGCYLELNAGRVSPGELLRLTIPLDKVSRTYSVDGQVVWSNSKGYWQGKPSAGIKFMNTGDVYRNLLDRL